MTTSSARPDALDEAARGLRASREQLHEAARVVWAAADAYASACTARPLSFASPSRTGATVADARDMTGDLHQLAAAFRTADGGTLERRAGAMATTTDWVLSATIVARHVSLGRELTGPSRELHRRGAALAAEMAQAAPRKGAAHALSLLGRLPAEIRSDPIFAAAVFNGLAPFQLEAITEELAFQELDWQDAFGPLHDLANLWATATRTLDMQSHAHRLDQSIIDEMLDSANGRNVLRALTGGADVGSGDRFLRQVIPPLLLHSAKADETTSNTYRHLLGYGLEDHPDAAMIHAISRPDLAIHFLTAAGTGTSDVQIVERTTQLLDMGKRAQPMTAAFIAQLLAHERFDPDHYSRDRTAILRATYAWVNENGPAQVTEPLAELVAGTLATDIDFYLGRVDTARRGDLDRVMQAVTEFERPWMAAILAFEYHGGRLVRESLHGSAEERMTALSGLTRLEDSFERAAKESDRPVERASGMFTVFGLVADIAFKVGKVRADVAIVARPVVDAALKAWHDSLQDDPDDHEDGTRRAREGLRRRIWTVIADDPELGRRIVWSVGGNGPDAGRALGSGITSIDELVALTANDSDLDELAGWADAQPDDLKALVDAYMDGQT